MGSYVFLYYLFSSVVLISNTVFHLCLLSVLPSYDSLILSLIQLIRQGIPPALRCGVWLSNIIQAVHPQQAAHYWHEYRTLGKVRALDGVYEMRLQQLASASNGGNEQKADVWSKMVAPGYGRKVAGNAVGLPAALQAQACEEGLLALKRILIALEEVLVGIEYAPLIPVLTAVLLTAMSESYAFCAIREMAHEAMYFFPVTPSEHVAWSRAFCDILTKLHKQTAKYLEDLGVLSDEHLKKYLFSDFFTEILPLRHVLRILDLYTLEGSKVIFRFGVVLLVLYKRHCSEENLNIQTATDWWETMHQWTHSPRLDFDAVVRKAYGVHGSGPRKQIRFPKRGILYRIIRTEEERYLDEQEEEAAAAGEFVAAGASRPLGLLPTSRPLKLDYMFCQQDLDEDRAVPVLACSVESRLRLADWVSVALRFTNLELLYSTNKHGRSLDLFYQRVKDVKHTILLAEVLTKKSAETADQSSLPVIVGMYASQAWRESSRVYGDGECFMFRLQPKPSCWKWKSNATAIGSTNSDFAAEETSFNNQTALLEQFMLSTDSFISMGGNSDGSYGLRFNEDLTRGESSEAAGFHNEPVHCVEDIGTTSGSADWNDFDVGLVEVYGFVREMDGKAPV